jgi:hypothetical protein
MFSSFWSKAPSSVGLDLSDPLLSLCPLFDWRGTRQINDDVFKKNVGEASLVGLGMAGKPT